MSSNSTLTMSRYFRLMALAGVELLCTTPLSVFQMVLNATAQPLDPWVSWDDTHLNFSNVRLVPAVIWSMNRWAVVGIQFNRWSGPFCAFIFFAFFGFASEARKNYRKAFYKVLAVCGLQRDPSSSQKPSSRLVALLVSVLTGSFSSALESSPLHPPLQCPLPSPNTLHLPPITGPRVLRQYLPRPTTTVLFLWHPQAPFQSSLYLLTKNLLSQNL